MALLLYVAVRRCRYFGNTAPLVMVLLLFPLVTTQTVSQPWLWALPFLFTFVGGVFADALETRQRKLFLVLSGGILVTQAMLCLTVSAGDRPLALAERRSGIGAASGASRFSSNLRTNSCIISRHPRETELP